MKRHALKTLPEYFSPLTNGSVEITLRKNDRDYQVNDIVCFHEWTEENGLTGRRSNSYHIKYVLCKAPGLIDGYVILLLGGPWYGHLPELLPDDKGYQA